MIAYKITDWDKHFENNRSREIAKTTWVPMPNRLDGDGYTELVDHPNGAAHFGAWCALVEVASRCDVRGTLLREGARPHNPASLSRITRLPEELWKEVIPRLINIGWVSTYDIPQEDAVIPHSDAAECRRKKERIEWNGIEWNGIEKKEKNKRITAVAVISEDDKILYHKVEQGFLGHNGDKFTNYALEGKAIKELILKAKKRDPINYQDLLITMCAQFWKLKQGTEKFWTEKPFLPHILANKIWDMVLESLRVDTIDPEVQKLISESAI